MDPKDMGKLSEKYVAQLVEKQILHPIPNRTCSRNLRTCCINSSQRATQRKSVDLQMAAIPVPIRFPEREEGTRGLFEG